MVTFQKMLIRMNCTDYYLLLWSLFCMNFIVNKHLFLFFPALSGRAFSDKVDRLKLAEIVKQAIEEKTNLEDSQ